MAYRMLRSAVLIGLVAVSPYAGKYAAWYWQDHSSELCQVSVVPLGDVDGHMLQSLVKKYESAYGVHIRVEAPISIEDGAIDFKRRQLIGEELVNLIKRRLPQLADDPSVMLMGVTAGDMYIAHKDWSFAFAFRESGRFSIISTARMDPVSFGFPQDDALLYARFAKMATKQFGLQYYGLREREEKTSVLYSPILGLDDLDETAADFDEVDWQRISKTVKPCNVV